MHGRFSLFFFWFAGLSHIYPFVFSYPQCLSRDDLSGAHKKRGAEYAPSVASDIIERLLLVDIELFPQLPLWKLDLNQNPPPRLMDQFIAIKAIKGGSCHAPPM